MLAALRPPLHVRDLVPGGRDEALPHGQLGRVDTELGRVLLHDLHGGRDCWPALYFQKDSEKYDIFVQSLGVIEVLSLENSTPI